ncbi:hypothetical protein HDR66_02410 [bacterium]|nr:hypothetical protein [bacterium]
MTRWQKILLGILFAIHVLFIYGCVDGYYDAIINGCADWGPSGRCPWGGEAMGIAWESPYSYVYFVSRDFIESLTVIIFAIFALRRKNAPLAILLLTLPLLIGLCTKILEMLLY